MIFKLTPAVSNYDYPLDIDKCAKWLLTMARWKVQSNLKVIRRVALLDAGVRFINGDREFTANEILDLIDRDGKLIGEDPRPKE